MFRFRMWGRGYSLLLTAFQAVAMTVVHGGCLDPVWVPYSSSLNLTDFAKLPNTADGLTVCSALNAQGIAVPGYVNFTGGTPTCFLTSASVPTFSSTNFKVLLRSAFVPGSEAITAVVMNPYLPANEIMGYNECAVSADDGNATAVSSVIGKIYVAFIQNPVVLVGSYEPGRGFTSAGNATWKWTNGMHVRVFREIPKVAYPRSTFSKTFSCFSNAAPMGNVVGELAGTQDRRECVVRCGWNPLCKQFKEMPMTSSESLFAGFKCVFYSSSYVGNASQSTVCVQHP